MPPKRRVADQNRSKRLAIHDALDKLLNKQLDPAFTGNIEIRIPAKGGRIGEPQYAVIRYGAPPE